MLSHFTFRPIVLVLLVLLVPAPLLRAAAPDNQAAKAANKILKTGGKEVLKEYQDDLKDAFAVFEIAADDFADEVLDGNFFSGTFNDLVDALALLQDTVQDDQEQAAQDFGAVTSFEALPEFEAQGGGDGNDLMGIYPRGFYPGAGGLVDDFYEDMEQVTAKAYAKAQKALRKLAVQLEKKAGVALTTQLFVPTPHPRVAADEGTVIFQTESTDIDFIVTASKLDTTGNGMIGVGGTGAGPDLEVSAGTMSDLVDPSGGRWSTTEFAVDEGVYELRLSDDASGQTIQELTLGVR